MSKFSLSLFKFFKERCKSFVSGPEFVSAFFVYFSTNLKNLKYDYETLQIMKKVLKKDSNCIDVGCHKGDVLRKMITYAPRGYHFAFEPLPDFFEKLQKKFGSKRSRIKVFPIALSNHKGQSTFNYVTSNPAYSGLKKRTYDYPDEKEREIVVQTDLLDNIISKNTAIDFIKIDVEGGELQVLEGGIETIKKNKPYIVFEHGLGAAEHYLTKPEQVYDFLEKCGLQVSLLEYFLAHREPLDRHEFIGQFTKKYNYYFIAYPKS